MEQEKIDRALWQMRVRILEALLLKLRVAFECSLSNRPASEVARDQAAQLEALAAALEGPMLRDPRLAGMTDAERAYWQDEVRELVESMQATLCGLFP